MKNHCGWTLLAGLIMLTGCQPHPTPMPADLYPSAIWHEGMVTFTDPILGVTLELPGDWRIVPQHSSSSQETSARDIFYSPCLSTAPIVLPPCTSIAIEQDTSGVQSLDEVKALIEKNGAVPQKVIGQWESDVNGWRALWTKVEDTNLEVSGSRTWLYVIIQFDGRDIRISAYGEWDPAISIVESLRSLHDDAPSVLGE